MEQAVQEQLNMIKNAVLTAIPVEQIYLFGSYAYGTPRADSDLDIYVVMKDKAPCDVLDAEHIIREAIHERKTTLVDILVTQCKDLNDYSVRPRYPDEIGITESRMKKTLADTKVVMDFIRLLYPEKDPPVQPDDH
jgi:predicted nucleotidyltransferase